MKRILIIITILALASTVFGAGLGLQASHVTDRQAGTIMISGGGNYRTDLDADLKRSVLGLNTDIALFFAPVLAVGVELGFGRDFREINDMDDPDERKETDLYLGPRAYFFFGGRHSELTPFIKGGPNFRRQKLYLNDEVVAESESELGITASVGVLLNLAKNVGISVEAVYNFDRGTAVEEIDTQQLLLQFGIRSFLGE